MYMYMSTLTAKHRMNIDIHKEPTSLPLALVTAALYVFINNVIVKITFL